MNGAVINLVAKYKSHHKRDLLTCQSNFTKDTMQIDGEKVRTLISTPNPLARGDLIKESATPIPTDLALHDIASGIPQVVKFPLGRYRKSLYPHLNDRGRARSVTT
jgi:hypothetical protein